MKCQADDANLQQCSKISIMHTFPLAFHSSKYTVVTFLDTLVVVFAFLLSSGDVMFLLRQAAEGSTPFQ